MKDVPVIILTGTDADADAGYAFHREQRQFDAPTSRMGSLARHLAQDAHPDASGLNHHITEMKETPRNMRRP
jgi:hypothetical protein